MSQALNLSLELSTAPNFIDGNVPVDKSVSINGETFSQELERQLVTHNQAKDVKTPLSNNAENKADDDTRELLKETNKANVQDVNNQKTLDNTSSNTDTVEVSATDVKPDVDDYFSASDRTEITGGDVDGMQVEQNSKLNAKSSTNQYHLSDELIMISEKNKTFDRIESDVDQTEKSQLEPLKSKSFAPSSSAKDLLLMLDKSITFIQPNNSVSQNQVADTLQPEASLTKGVHVKSELVTPTFVNNPNQNEKPEIKLTQQLSKETIEKSDGVLSLVNGELISSTEVDKKQVDGVALPPNTTKNESAIQHHGVKESVFSKQEFNQVKTSALHKTGIENIPNHNQQELQNQQFKATDIDKAVSSHTTSFNTSALGSTENISGVIDSEVANLVRPLSDSLEKPFNKSNGLKVEETSKAFLNNKVEENLATKSKMESVNQEQVKVTDHKLVNALEVEHQSKVNNTQNTSTAIKQINVATQDVAIERSNVKIESQNSELSDEELSLKTDVELKQSIEVTQAKLAAQSNTNPFTLRSEVTTRIEATNSQYVQHVDEVSAEQLSIERSNTSQQIQEQAKAGDKLSSTIININDKNFTEKVKEKVMVMVNQKLQSVDIQLDPPELGNVHVRVNLQGEQAVVSFMVQQQQTKDALEQHMSKLKDMLSESGIDLGQSDIQQEFKNHDGDAQENEHSANSSVSSLSSSEDDVLHQNNQQVVNVQSIGVDYFA